MLKKKPVGKAEGFREDLKGGTEQAIRAVEKVARSSRDPRVQREAREYLAKHKK